MSLHTTPGFLFLSLTLGFELAQLDIVCPSSNALENVLSDISTSYVKTKSKLAPFVELVKNYINPLTFESDIIAIGYSSPWTDETWCIDTRGVLTLSVGKQTYQRLGLVGTKLPWKECQGQYIIVLAQKLPDESSKGTKSWTLLGPKQIASLELYDRLRQQAGLDSWEVLYHCTKQSVLSPEHKSTEALLQTAKMSDVHVPIPDLVPPQDGDDDAIADWNESISDLYEWVGMACCGAQRLHINDRIDPYAAVYTPPQPSYMGTITHIRWRGLLHPSFVQAVWKAALDHISNHREGEPLFVAITSHSIPISPVVYIPPSPSGHSVPLRLAREDAEDTLSIILTGAGSVGGDDGSDGMTVKWCSIECIGRWDMRWG